MNNEILEWKNFKGETWKKEINVSAFIDDNFTEYTGDDKFLTSTLLEVKNSKDFFKSFGCGE